MYFGTDGIRGAYGSAIMNESFAKKIGAAIGKYVKAKCNYTPTILVGRDTRPSGPSLQNSLTEGLQSSSVTVLDCGVIPTPALAFGIHHHQADFGVMITASHNPFSDNGIKCFTPKGTKLSPEDEEFLETLIDHDYQSNHCSQKVDKLHLLESYREFIHSLFPQNNLEGMRIVTDLANGATCHTTPQVLEEMGATVISIHRGCGTINDQCGSEYLNPLQSSVQYNKADLGIAHDGDGDRVRFVDSNGITVSGDKILGIIALHAKSLKNLKSNTFVSTIHSNSGLSSSLQEHGISCPRADVGDRNVFLKMQKLGANWGGESSGHIIGLDFLPTGDGLIAALMVLQAVKQSKNNIRTLAESITLWPAKSDSFLVREKIPLNEIPSLSNAIDEEKRKAGLNGRILFRYSGTEKKARLLVEGKDNHWVNTAFDRICKSILELL